MNINSPNDLYSFVKRHGIVGLCPETQNLVSCMDIFLRMCTCDSQESKTTRYNLCKQHYINFVSRSKSHCGILLAKANDNRMSFYINGQMIATITR